MLQSDARLLRIFGRSVQRARKRLEIPQEMLAERAHLSRNYVSDIERGVRNPGLVVVVRLARALKLPLSDLLSEIEEEQ